MTANPKKLGLYRTTTFFRAFLMFAVDLFGYALFLPWVIYRHLHGKTFDPERVSKIAVFRLDGIGDLVLSAPAINALRKFFPKARITLFANKWSNGLAEMISGPDEVIYLDATFFKAFKKKVTVHSLLKERRQLLRIGRNRRYDLALDLRGDFFSILDACWLKPRWLFSRSSRAGSFLLTNMLAQAQEGYVSEALLNIRFIGKVTKQRTPPSNPELKPPPELDLNWIDQKLGDDYVCLAVAAPYVTRCYPTESWLEVIVKIRQKYKKPIAVLGSPDEYQYCQVITAQADEDVHNMAGKLSLTELWPL